MNPVTIIVSIEKIFCSDHSFLKFLFVENDVSLGLVRLAFHERRHAVDCV